MANSLTLKITEDGRRNAIVSLVGIVDTANLNVIRAIPLTGFQVRHDTHRGTLNGLALRRVAYAITPGLNVLLAWNSNSPEPMAALAGAGVMDRRAQGATPPNKLVSGYEGSINVSTTGFVAGTAYTFTLDLWMIKKYPA